jgi:acetyl esterase/lipase
VEIAMRAPVSRLLPMLFVILSLHVFAAEPAASAAPPLEIVLVPEAVDKPTIYVHLPTEEKRNGAAVVICPGGGYGGLSMESEGHATARWLNEFGVAGIVLKYRLPGKNGNTHDMPLADAHAAIRLVRQHAAEWKIDPKRVGVMGYSAGGHLASTAGTHYDAETRPDFLLLIYPVITMGEFTHGGSKHNLLGKDPSPELVKLYSNELQVTKDTPPTFLAHASDDRGVNVRNSVDFYLALYRNGVPAELHVYEVGNHGLKGGAGYGIGGPSKAVASTWTDRAYDWMKQRGLLEKQ